MNHIHRLQRERDDALEKLRSRDDAVRLFRAHLCGAKFQGFDPDGARRDWIAISDVFAWLRVIETAARENWVDDDAERGA